jgi:hypothetical protein
MEIGYVIGAFIPLAALIYGASIWISKPLPRNLAETLYVSDISAMIVGCPSASASVGFVKITQACWSEHLGCQCGAGMPCECLRVDGSEPRRLLTPDVGSLNVRYLPPVITTPIDTKLAPFNQNIWVEGVETMRSIIPEGTPRSVAIRAIAAVAALDACVSSPDSLDAA